MSYTSLIIFLPAEELRIIMLNVESICIFLLKIEKCPWRRDFIASNLLLPCRPVLTVALREMQRCREKTGAEADEVNRVATEVIAYTRMSHWSIWGI